MSDTWYRDPVELPPYEDWRGNLWTWDGRCLNPVHGPERDPFAMRALAVLIDEEWRKAIAEAEEHYWESMLRSLGIEDSRKWTLPSN